MHLSAFSFKIGLHAGDSFEHPTHPHHMFTLLHGHHSSPLLPPTTSSKSPIKKATSQDTVPSAMRRSLPKPPPLAGLQLHWEGYVSPSSQSQKPRQAVAIPPPSEKPFLRPPRKPPDIEAKYQI